MKQVDIFDPKSVIKHHRRASPDFKKYDFLFREVAARISDRLGDISKQFELAAEIGDQKDILFEELEKSGSLQMRGIKKFFCFGLEGEVRLNQEMLPIAANSLNLILSNLNLHWINDLPGVLYQIRHALSPDGLFLGTLFGGNTLSELRESLVRAELDLTGKASPRVSPFLDIRDAGNLLQRAGFNLIVADIDTISIKYKDPLMLLHDLRCMGQTNALNERIKSFSRRDVIMRANNIYMEEFADKNQEIPATFQIIYLTGWAPHSSQQKPLRPGSATQSLAKLLSESEKSFNKKN